MLKFFLQKLYLASNAVLLCIDYLVFICLFNYYGIVSLSKANDILDKSFFDGIWKFYFLPCHVWIKFLIKIDESITAFLEKNEIV